MSEPSDDLRRRVERLEMIQSELQALMRESTMMAARLNETLIELKNEFRDMRVELRDIHDLELEVANLKTGFAAIKWLGMTAGGGGVLMVLAYLFKVQP